MNRKGYRDYFQGNSGRLTPREIFFLPQITSRCLEIAQIFTDHGALSRGTG